MMPGHPVAGRRRLRRRGIVLIRRFIVGQARTTGATNHGHHGPDDSIHRLQRPHPRRQPIPRLQRGRQTLSPVPLEHRQRRGTDRNDAEDGQDDGQNTVTRRREPEHDQRHDEEHPDQVDDGEPPVSGGGGAEPLGQADRQAGRRQRVEERDAGDVEQKVAEGDLQSGLEAVGRRRQRGQHPGTRRADVGTERQRVDALEGEDADTDQRSQGRREHRAALNERSQYRSGQHSHVAG